MHSKKQRHTNFKLKGKSANDIVNPILSLAGNSGLYRVSGDDIEMNELLRIKALGNLLQYYHSDLTYILNFQQCKQKTILISNYLLKSPGSFHSFLNEFRIARNVREERVSDLLKLTMEWVDHPNEADKVDEFADKLREEGITQRDDTMTSLASKILFLNNPWVILPCDTLTRRAVGVKTNKYSDFCSAARDMLKRETLPINNYLKPVDGYIRTIEKGFKGKIDKISKIRRNRVVDKILWVQGQKLALSKANGNKTLIMTCS